MPASRVTSASPWHVVLVGNAQPDKRESMAPVSEALDFMIEEMSLISGGGKPLFRVSIVDGSRQPQIVAEAARDVEAAELLAAAKPARKTRKPPQLADLLNTARSILETHQGNRTDHTPWVIVMSNNASGDQRAEAAAEALKTLNISAGAPRVAVFDFQTVASPMLQAIVSDATLYRQIASPDAVAVALPTLVNIGGSARADGDPTAGRSIRTI